MIPKLFDFFAVSLHQRLTDISVGTTVGIAGFVGIGKFTRDVGVVEGSILVFAVRDFFVFHNRLKRRQYVY